MLLLKKFQIVWRSGVRRKIFNIQSPILITLGATSRRVAVSFSASPFSHARGFHRTQMVACNYTKNIFRPNEPLHARRFRAKSAPCTRSEPVQPAFSTSTRIKKITHTFQRKATLEPVYWCELFWNVVEFHLLKPSRHKRNIENEW